MTKQVRVGVGSLIIKNNKILLGLRKGAHASGVWSPPGGHLEFEEDVITCAKREALEECNIELLDTEELRGFTNDIFTKDNKHYISLFTLTTQFNGELKNNEPHKCEEWKWFDLDDLPDNLMLPLKNFINKYGIKELTKETS